MAAITPAATSRAAGQPASCQPSGSCWTAAFLAALADTSNVRAAARKAGVAAATVYDRRRSDAEFSRAWQLALCEGYDNLEMELLHRLRSGELKPASGAKRAVRSFDNAIAFRLLLAHRESAVRARATRENVSAAEVRASIDRKVAEIRDRVLAAKAAREAAALPAPAQSAPVPSESEALPHEG